MTFQALDQHGWGLVAPGNTIGEGDPTNPSSEVQALVERGELLDRALKPYLLHYAQDITDLGGAYPAIGATGLNGHLFRRWILRVPRTSVLDGSFTFAARAAYNTGPGPGKLHIVFYQTDLTTVLGTASLSFAGATPSESFVSVPQPQNPDTWFIAAVYLENVDVNWFRLVGNQDSATPDVEP